MAADLQRCGSRDRCAIIPAMVMNGRLQIRSRWFEKRLGRENDVGAMNRVCSSVMLAVASAIAFQAIAGEPPHFFSEHPGKVEIRVSEEGLRSLRLNSRRDVAVQVAAFGREWRDAPMRLKGRGTFQTVDEKPSLTIDFRG